MRKWETGVVFTLVCLLVISLVVIIYRDWQISGWYASELERRTAYEKQISELEEANQTAHREIERLNGIIAELDHGVLSADLSLNLGNDTQTVEGVIINFGAETATDIYVITEFFKNSPSAAILFHTERMNVTDILGRTYVRIYQIFQFKIEGTFSFWHYCVHWKYNGVDHAITYV